MENIEIKKKGNKYIININGFERWTIDKPTLSGLRPGTADQSDWILHLAGKADINSEDMREKILLPLAKITEAYYPGVMNWVQTFFEAERILLQTAHDNYQDTTTDNFDLDSIDLLDDVTHELEEEQAKKTICAYLGKANLIQ